MFHLIFYQFQFSKKLWLSMIPLFLAAGIIIGLSLNGIFNIRDNLHTLQVNDPTPIFIFPVVFGGITLFFSISTSIQLLIDMLKKDYECWAIVGASRVHIAFLVGGQMSLIASFSSLLAYLISIPSTYHYYYFLQQFFGKDWLPDIPLRFNVLAGTSSILLLTSIAFISGAFHTYKLLASQYRKQSKVARILKFIKNVTLSLIILSLEGYLFYQILQPHTMSSKSLFLFYFLFTHLFLIYLLFPHLQLFLIRIFPTSFFKNHYAPIIAKWTIFHQPLYLKSLNTSILSAITLMSGFQLLSQNIFYLFQENADLEMKVSFFIYLGAPLIVILSNIISITSLSIEKEKQDKIQLDTLGASPYHLCIINIWQASIHILTIFFISLGFNGFLLFCISYVLKENQKLLATISGLFLPGLIISSILFILLLLTNLWSNQSFQKKISKNI
ncbi:hypothetical protein [Streptococcus cuniculi]|uniref:FtsX-like permease family protein n=1 Tax=Streptococcus cuniculi TaxID=1432788 RepID=A0A4Y9JAN3_9STRE|nr:hypothetical protein [Streptococcus cuniculi]MBF0778856.1 hypothetical protein [Streptococcus cuniculi]TFU97238.1 hypothetical protein E4T82_09020 [Streptococcus cuniculi]